MKTKKLSLLIMTLLISQMFISISSAEPMSFRGYVYYGSEIVQPEQVIANIDGNEYYADVSTGIYGYYAFDFEANLGDVISFDVVYSGYTYEAVRIHTIKKPVNKNFNLTIDDTINLKPYTPSAPTPVDDATNQDINVDLSWSGGDPNGDNVTYTIYFGTSSTSIPLVKENHSDTSYDPGALIYNKMYYWQILAIDEYGEEAEGPIWQFKTKSASPPPSPGDDDDDVVTGDDDDFVDPGGNLLPIAVATVDVNTGPPGLVCNFDASGSSDPEETDLNYTWDFDDGNIGYGETIAHTFSSVGVYEVMLTVEDAGGATDTLDDPIIIEVIAGNNPPTGLTISPSTTMTTKNTNVSFTLSATDTDENDSIIFTIDWDDGETTTSEAYNSTEEFVTTHQWETYGVYDLSVTAKDTENATTETSATVWVDVYVIDDEITGWLIDTDSDGTYDVFRNTETDEDTDVQKQNENEYLIDADGDETWDYIFNVNTETLSVYEAEDSSDDGLNIGLIVLGLLIIVLILVFVYLSQKNKKEQKKREEQKKKKEESKKQDKSKKQSSKRTKSKK